VGTDGVPRRFRATGCLNGTLIVVQKAAFFLAVLAAIGLWAIIVRRSS